MSGHLRGTAGFKAFSKGADLPRLLFLLPANLSPPKQADYLCPLILVQHSFDLKTSQIMHCGNQEDLQLQAKYEEL